MSRNADTPAGFMAQALMAAPWGFAITDHQREDTPIVFLNTAFEALCEQAPGEALGKSWQCLMGRDPEKQSLAKIRDAIHQGTHCSVRLQRIGIDGSRLHDELSMSPVLNESGEIAHLIWLRREITSQVAREKRQAALIKEKDQRFSSYSRIATEAIWRLDFAPPIRLDLPISKQVLDIFENAVFTEANDAGACIYGFTKAEDIIDKSLKTFMDYSNPNNVEQVAHLVRNGFRMNNLISHEKDIDGITHVIVNNLIPIEEDGRVRAVWGASLDITEQFDATRALDQKTKELAKKSKDLEQKNAALNELIDHIESDKRDLEDRIAANVEQLLLPSLEKIRLSANREAYIEQHRQALENLTSSFGRKIADNMLRLTPREIEVCNLVKNGMSSKEIAALLKIALHTVEKHRRTARYKLNLANKGINLRTYLNSV
jgi:PAS domain S-box-containing protein